MEGSAVGYTFAIAGTTAASATRGRRHEEEEEGGGGLTASDRPRSKVARVGGSTKRKPELITRAGNIRDLGSMDPSNAAFTVSSLYFNRPRFRAIKASPTDSFALSTVSPPSPPFFFQLSSREGHILGMEINHRKFFSSLRNSRRCAKIKDLYATEFLIPKLIQLMSITVLSSSLFQVYINSCS